MDLSSSLDYKLPEDPIYLIHPSTKMSQGPTLGQPGKNTKTDKAEVLRQLIVHQWRQEHVKAIPGMEATQCEL